MANGKIQPFTSLKQSKHHCYTLSTTCTLFKLASKVGPRTKQRIMRCHNFMVPNENNIYLFIHIYFSKNQKKVHIHARPKHEYPLYM